MRVAEPLAGPHPVEAPAEPFEVFLSQSVAVPRARRAMVTVSISLDGQNHSPWLLRMHESEVDPVSGYAPLPDVLLLVGVQCFCDAALETVRLAGHFPPDF